MNNTLFSEKNLSKTHSKSVSESIEFEFKDLKGNKIMIKPTIIKWTPKNK